MFEFAVSQRNTVTSLSGPCTYKHTPTYGVASARQVVTGGYHTGAQHRNRFHGTCSVADNQCPAPLPLPSRIFNHTLFWCACQVDAQQTTTAMRGARISHDKR